MSNERISISVSEQPRHRGGGWRVRCFATPTNDWNALSSTIFENKYRSEAAARKKAKELAKIYGGSIL